LANKHALKHHFEKKKIDISFPIEKGKDYDLTLDLFDEIVPDNTKVNVNLSVI